MVNSFEKIQNSGKSCLLDRDDLLDDETLFIDDGFRDGGFLDECFRADGFFIDDGFIFFLFLLLLFEEEIFSSITSILSTETDGFERFLFLLFDI
jgi:hypothetical protein